MLLLLLLTLFSTPEYKVYLPTISRPISECGVEVWRDEIYTEQLQLSGCSFVRYNHGTAFEPGLYYAFLNNDLETAIQDLATIKATNKHPVVVFMGNEKGTCEPLSSDHYEDFANFISVFVASQDLDYIEIWNEADATGGLAYLYGCWGVGEGQAFTEMLTQVSSIVWASHPDLKIGTSFMYNTSDSWPMLASVLEMFVNEPRFILGIHHYRYYGFEESLSLEEKVNTIRAIWYGPLWLTETNLLLWSPSASCGNPPQIFKDAQAAYVNEVMHNLAIDVKIFYGLWPYQSRWYCGSLLENDLSPAPAYLQLIP